MQYLFGYSWHDEDRHPIEEMTEEQARSAWEHGPQLGVAAGKVLGGGQVPAYTLEANARGKDVRVRHYTPEGSVATTLDYGTFAGRLFLEQVMEYLYPDDGEFHTGFSATAVRVYVFKPGGYARLRNRVTVTGTETVEEFAGVDVAQHWVGPLTWGDWDSIGLHEAGNLPG